MNNLIIFCDRLIVWSFYFLIFLVPLIFAANTSELFEFNKMWLTFGLTIIIGGAWITKMIAERRIYVQKTIFDIPLVLFLVSQLISTIFSLDQHISWWGYYSRFNGGFLSLFSYVLLYYAFVSNVSLKQTLRMLSVSLVAGLLVALWGFPSHFGADPTCFVFRGSFDTTCWTDAFKPTIRAFSTLGQPAWFAAYLALLLPIAFAYALKVSPNGKNINVKQATKSSLWNWKFVTFLLLSALFYLDLIFADTRAGTIAFFIVEILFWVLIYIKNIFSRSLFLRYVIIFHVLMIVCSFLFGMPSPNLNKYTLGGLMQHAPTPTPAPTTTDGTVVVAPAGVPAPNITDSGKIRLLVWEGAIKAWKDNPVFGTGVETFAFAYYKYRPTAHNLTSEWDYLYNKAHNEYLNYLTTTGLFGLGTYLAIIALFIFYFAKNSFMRNQQATEEPHHQQQHKQKKYAEIIIEDWQRDVLSIALFTGWVSILITNFFGFSVVIMNIYLFLIPAFYLILNGLLKEEKIWEFTFGSAHTLNPYQWTLVTMTTIIAIYLISSLINFWNADVAYALGMNLDHIGNYQPAYPQLVQAVKMVPDEPVYKDELSINMAVLATALYGQKGGANEGQQAANQAIALSDEVINGHPNNVVFLKNRVRIFYTLAQVNQSQSQQYLLEAMKAITKANQLAPTDAKISYNLGLVYGQTGDIQKGIDILKKTIQMKPDYRDAYFALGLYYHQLSVDKNNKVTDPTMHQKAIDTYNYILLHISPGDKSIESSIKTWEGEK